MSGSILPNITYAAADVPLYAAAGSGGGGGGSTIVTSALTVSSITNGGQPININGATVSGSGAILSPSGVGITSNGNTLNEVFVSGGSAASIRYTAAGAGAIEGEIQFISSINGQEGGVVIYSQGAAAALVVGGGDGANVTVGPGRFNVPGTANISTLNVNTINGRPANSQVIAWNSVPTVTVAPTGSTLFRVSDYFSTTVGKNYTVTAQVSASNAGNDGTNFLAVTNGAPATNEQYLYYTKTSWISTLNSEQGVAGSSPINGLCAVYNADSNAAALWAINSSAANNTTLNVSGKIIVTQQD